MTAAGGKQREKKRAGRAKPARLSWRGLELEAVPNYSAYETRRVSVGGHRYSWRAERLAHSWHAWLKVDADRYCATGRTHRSALDAAARTVSTLASLLAAILVELPPPKRRRP